MNPAGNSFRKPGVRQRFVPRKFSGAPDRQEKIKATQSGVLPRHSGEKNSKPQLPPLEFGLKPSDPFRSRHSHLKHKCQ
jgi:hypothetical protein